MPHSASSDASELRMIRPCCAVLSQSPAEDTSVALHCCWVHIKIFQILIRTASDLVSVSPVCFSVLGPHPSPPRLQARKPSFSSLNTHHSFLLRGSAWNPLSSPTPFLPTHFSRLTFTHPSGPAETAHLHLSRTLQGPPNSCFSCFTEGTYYSTWREVQWFSQSQCPGEI